ncbi:hypothetical protein MMC12_006698 [Toensbergia leucococca]|nr:hypothetical protein [Toensbergia leucococca]
MLSTRIICFITALLTLFISSGSSSSTAGGSTFETSTVASSNPFSASSSPSSTVASQSQSAWSVFLSTNSAGVPIITVAGGGDTPKDDQVEDVTIIAAVGTILGFAFADLVGAIAWHYAKRGTRAAERMELRSMGESQKVSKILTNKTPEREPLTPEENQSENRRNEAENRPGDDGADGLRDGETEVRDGAHGVRDDGDEEGDEGGNAGGDEGMNGGGNEETNEEGDEGGMTGTNDGAGEEKEPSTTNEFEDLVDLTSEDTLPDFTTSESF